MDIHIGSVVMAFNAIEWSKTGDTSDFNERFWQKATVINIRKDPQGGQLIDVRFEDGPESHGHFHTSIRPYSAKNRIMLKVDPIERLSEFMGKVLFKHKRPIQMAWSHGDGTFGIFNKWDGFANDIMEVEKEFDGEISVVMRSVE